MATGAYDMSTLRVDTITDEAGTGPVEFTNGINVSGGTVTGIDPFKYNAVSGTTQALDVGTYNFFDAGTLTANTTVSFSNVPTEARWTYTADVGIATSFDLEAGSYDSVNFYIGNEELNNYGIFFKPDGTKMYATGPITDIVWQYSTASPFVVTLPASVQNPPVESVLYDDTIAYTFFTADGGTTVKLINEEVL